MRINKIILIAAISIVANVSFCFSQSSGHHLFETIQKNDLDALAVALGEGADVNEEDEGGNSLLMFAAAENNWMAFVMLYNFGGRIDAVNKKGENIETIASNSNSEGIILFFENKNLVIDRYNCVTGNSNTVKLFNANRYDEGKKNAEKMTSLCLSCFGTEHPDYAESLYNLSFVYYFFGNTKKALPLTIESLRISEINFKEPTVDYAGGLELLADIYGATSENDKIEINLKKAESIYKKNLGDSHMLYFRNLDKQASFYYEIGRYKEAFDLYQFVLEHINSEDYKFIYVIVLGNMAKLYLGMGDYEKAEYFFLKCAAVIEKDFGKENIIYETHLNNISSLYHDKGMYDKSLRILLETKTSRKNKLGENHPDYAITLSNLGNLYSDLGQFEKALQLFEESKTIVALALGDSHPHFAMSLMQIGEIHAINEDYEKALSFYEKALAIAKEIHGENHRFYARILNKIGSLYSKMGRGNEAIEVLNESLGINKEIFGINHINTSAILARLAKAYQEIGAYEESNIKYRESLIIKENIIGGKNLSCVSNILNLAINNELIGKEKESIRLIKDAMNLYLENITMNTAVLNENDIIQYLKKINVRSYIVESTLYRLKEKGSFRKNNKHLYNLKVQTKALAFLNNKNVRSSVIKHKDTLIGIHDKYQVLKYQYSKTCLLTISERNKRGLDLEKIKKEIDDLETELTLGYDSKKINVRYKNLTKNLLKKEASIDFTHFRYHNGKQFTDSILYAAYLSLPKSKHPIFIPLAEQREIQALLKESIGSKNGMDYIQSQETGQELYKLIFAPLEKHLKGIKTIHISASGILHKVAFHSLHKKEGLLMDNYDIHYQGTMRDFVTKRTNKEETLQTNQNITLFGNPDFNATLGKVETEGLYDIDSIWATRNSRDGFNPLPQTKIEVESIEKYARSNSWETNSKLGIEASEANFKSLSGKKARVIHLATHGYALNRNEEGKEEIPSLENNERIARQKNPLFRSGLALSGGNTTWKANTLPATEEDGLLTAYEISMMDLFDTDLVVLSACNTGLGDIISGEGVFGLQRAFKTAGVKNLIVSLWEVDDKATRLLMEKFYKHYFDGKNAHESLALAQEEMRNTKDYNKPIYWAGFILIE